MSGSEGSAPVMPWKLGNGQTASTSGRMAVLFAGKGPNRAPEAEQLAPFGIQLHEQEISLASLSENAAMLRDADAIVVEVSPNSQSDLEMLDGLIQLAGGDLPIIAAVEGLTVSHTRTLLRAGVVDVLPLPFTAEDLFQSVEPSRRSSRAAPARAAAPRKQGKVVTFVGALGGVGSTSIAVHMGTMWAKHSQVGLLDLNIQYGSAALFLDLHPSTTVGDLIDGEERIDVELLRSVAMRHSTGLSVVASPTDIMPVEVVTTEFIDNLLRTATQAYDHVLVDLPRLWNEWTVRAMQRADIVCLVMNLSVPGIFQARRQLEVLDANGLLPRLKIVANRVQHRMFRPADLKETEAVLGRKIDFTIANDYPTISSANDQGRAIREVGGTTRVLKDMAALAKALEAELAVEGALL